MSCEIDDDVKSSPESRDYFELLSVSLQRCDIGQNHSLTVDRDEMGQHNKKH